MSKLVLNPEYKLYERNSQAFCGSRQVSDEFQREHRNVLRDIDNLISNLLKLERINPAEHFIEVTYKDSRGRKQREILMSRDGFTLLVMGFEGEKALAFKVEYMNRFNAMEAFIQSLAAAKLDHPAFTDAIMNAHEEPKHYHFSNEADIINRIVLGMSAKQFREANGLDKGISIRPYLSSEQIKAIETLQRVDIGMIIAIPEYEQRKQVLTTYYERLKSKRIAIA